MNPWMGLPVVLCSIFAGVCVVQVIRYEWFLRRNAKRRHDDPKG